MSDTNLFKSGDPVRIGLTPRTRGTIVGAVSYSELHKITVYRVILAGGFQVNVPDSHLSPWVEYDGNVVGSWADLRHIWRPK